MPGCVYGGCVAVIVTGVKLDSYLQQLRDMVVALGSSGMAR